MKRYSLNSIVGGRYKAIILKQLIKSLVDVKTLGERQGSRLPKFYTLEELRIIRDACLKRRATIKIAYYAETEEARIFSKLATFIKEEEQKHA
ncbi:hypothetical protein CAV_0591 [Campylobacter avium LMG 24591]|uniref:Uncharacterized protein n=1 Tax=Campylobacter avium LMG 24591 TaxID=522484 RepID=A0A222MX42_9BACT|nr:hypothetical protein [Campylobacter avium]ASQ30258.1 hypothetical protein CAV_0591 [Campylobacter avium LMG 24591]OYD79356.1 hypothetical protein CAV8706_0593 [Campylobacter avium]